MKAELLSPTAPFGMEAGSSNAHVGPRGPNMPQGASQAREPPGEPRPEEHKQQGHKPLFYFQPSQPYMPMQGLQWPVPMAVPIGYNPYYGVTPFGYGMSMMPHYQPNPYMEAPTFVMPHTHLHLTDYRRMLNPYYYQTMAYHTRRYRYQHGPLAREVTSSEVQTEPLECTLTTSNSCSAETETSRVLKVSDVEVAPIGPHSQPLQPALTVQSNDEPSLGVGAPPNGSFFIQTEEVTIECCTTPVGLQLLHPQDTAEVSKFPSEDVPGVYPDQACPDILLVGNPGEKSRGSEESMKHEDVVKETTADDLPLTPKSTKSDVDIDEQTVWSIEDTLVPSPDSFASPEEHTGIIHVTEVPKDEPPTKDRDCEIEVCNTMKESHNVELEEKAETPPRQEPNYHDHQDTSFESLPAYLPSSTWLADFDRVYVCSRMPPTPKKQNQRVNRTPLEVPARRRKLELEYREQPSLRKPKERYKPKGKTDRRCLSDHECCLTTTFNENIFTLKRERLCTRCLSKPRQGFKRKSAPFRQYNQDLMSTCDTCQKLHRKGSVPDIRRLRCRPDTEGESSENGSRRPDGPKRLLSSKQNRDKNCTCDEGLPSRVVALEKLRHCPHGNAMRELNENLPAALQEKLRRTDQLYWTRRSQSEKSWKILATNPDSTRSPHLNKHKMSQSQGMYRKDTQC
ncbi:bucky ball-like [Corythoichthys intestinalis]|uniref:bucky ball-like n=1 Tax=Corythoichthys intestinalis TaxID=161448 RepID=UPI0025A674BC|nr:bucky ball-like [Corythoichthys intestinalis]